MEKRRFCWPPGSGMSNWKMTGISRVIVWCYARDQIEVGIVFASRYFGGKIYTVRREVVSKGRHYFRKTAATSDEQNINQALILAATKRASSLKKHKKNFFLSRNISENCLGKKGGKAMKGSWRCTSAKRLQYRRKWGLMNGYRAGVENIYDRVMILNRRAAAHQCATLSS